MQTRWPTLLPRPAVPGTIRTSPEDFRVEEIPAYTPQGHGQHLMVEIEKRNLTTREAIARLARSLGISPRDVGCAGMKDRHAVSRQWLSVPAAAAGGLEGLSTDDLQVLTAGMHPNKIKTGHLRGNRFAVVVRGPDASARAEIEQRLEQLRHTGVPNYFGTQRFGADGHNEQAGRALLTGTGLRIRDRGKLRLLLNAVQSALFNDLLADRIRQGLFGRVLEGDLLVRGPSGATFSCEDPVREQERADRLEIHPTGPMFGPKMARPGGLPAAMEASVLGRSDLDDSCWRRFPKLTRGTRRALRMVPDDPRMEPAADGLVLRFALPAGCYATSLLSELIDVRDATRGQVVRDAIR